LRKHDNEENEDPEVDTALNVKNKSKKVIKAVSPSKMQKTGSIDAKTSGAMQKKLDIKQEPKATGEKKRKKKIQVTFLHNRILGDLGLARQSSC
jgi:hypothetical protein